MTKGRRRYPTIDRDLGGHQQTEGSWKGHPIDSTGGMERPHRPASNEVKSVLDHSSAPSQRRDSPFLPRHICINETLKNVL